MTSNRRRNLVEFWSRRRSTIHQRRFDVDFLTQNQRRKPTLFQRYFDVARYAVYIANLKKKMNALQCQGNLCVESNILTQNLHGQDAIRRIFNLFSTSFSRRHIDVQR